ncbi:hypothetical protein [Rheinheimera gaetbuli]
MKDFLNLDESLFTSTTPEGFIEITALDELDKIVGGFLNSDELSLILNETPAGS